MEKKKSIINLACDITYLALLFISAILLIFYSKNIKENESLSNIGSILEFTISYLVTTIILIIVNVYCIVKKMNTNPIRCIKLFTISIYSYLLSSSLFGKELVSQLSNNICSGLALIVLVGEIILFFTDITNKEVYQIVFLVLINTSLVLNFKVDSPLCKASIVFTILSLVSYIVKLVISIYINGIKVNKVKDLEDRA